ncbi:putative armadillo-like helical, importin beta family [Helianthus annuus]|nr:putative armadillo-like helical, importin beta family [Helianthus annuus]
MFLSVTYILFQIGEILGTLIKTFKASFLPFFDEMSSYLMPMWGKDKTAEERRIAICIFDDVAEQCREAALKYYDTYLPFLLEACNDENPDVRQVSIITGHFFVTSVSLLTVFF